MNVQLKSPKEMAKNSIEWFVILALVALGLRFIFRIFGAEGVGSGFVTWLYDTTNVLLQPVRGVFPQQAAVHSKYVLESATLFAMVAYMAVGNVAMGLVERWSPKR
ncbi:MAG TPA: hypothetical protein VLE74_03000 [Candidatus Saccharimonadales bacterium]|nr:hypothetical protein [Candidatus Saccharimonadales bacterium]